MLEVGQVKDSLAALILSVDITNLAWYHLRLTNPLSLVVKPVTSLQRWTGIRITPFNPRKDYSRKPVY